MCAGQRVGGLVASEGYEEVYLELGRDSLKRGQRLTHQDVVVSRVLDRNGTVVGLGRQITPRSLKGMSGCATSKAGKTWVTSLLVRYSSLSQHYQLKFRMQYAIKDVFRRSNAIFALNRYFGTNATDRKISTYPRA